ncbi:hypothetical protein SB773_33215, partial [Bacillus sp. SIMBA_074]|uniref:hypothetical protein n=1 Tax=Bacillus sp. SIMBA_074 TaxID=3085812 RepID=UPI00397CB23E
GNNQWVCSNGCCEGKGAAQVWEGPPDSRRLMEKSISFFVLDGLYPVIHFFTRFLETYALDAIGHHF